MNKQELIKAISEDTGFTQVDVSKFASSFEGILKELMVKGKKLQWTGWFIVKPAYRAARKGYDPIKLQPLDIEASIGIDISAGEKLKAVLDSLEPAVAKKLEDEYKEKKAKKDSKKKPQEEATTAGTPEDASTTEPVVDPVTATTDHA